MGDEKLTQSSILFGIICNFPHFCGEERAKEARDYVASAFAELKRYREKGPVEELERVVRCKDCRFHIKRKCLIDGVYTNPGDYCGAAQKKGGNHEKD